LLAESVPQLESFLVVAEAEQVLLVLPQQQLREETVDRVFVLPLQAQEFFTLAVAVVELVLVALVWLLLAQEMEQLIMFVAAMLHPIVVLVAVAAVGHLHMVPLVAMAVLASSSFVTPHHNQHQFPQQEAFR
jgi:hypothetical protein